ncbi:UNVERIFIED_ORG: MbcA/ParS/Xre antitoxin family protein [Shinella sp. XGS7]|nr:MbcA/ParS/Xre antitoxin family protein [Shinella sp. XGS7]
MTNENNGWNIGRVGRTWTGPEGLEKLNRLPGRLEMVRGKLCLDEAQRLTLLAGLLENIGIDDVVKLGKLEDWQQAVAARGDADAERELSDSVSGDVPERYWNCRVIEFESEEETWYAIHEVHYAHGMPVAHTVEPATPGWSSIDDPGGALRQLARFREALRKPFLKVSDFEGAATKAELLDKLGRMVEEGGGNRDMATLSAWLNAWLSEPLPELNGSTPSQLLHSEDGRRQVETLLERMRGGPCAWDV